MQTMITKQSLALFNIGTSTCGATFIKALHVHALQPGTRLENEDLPNSADTKIRVIPNR